MLTKVKKCGTAAQCTLFTDNDFTLKLSDKEYVNLNPEQIADIAERIYRIQQYTCDVVCSERRHKKLWRLLSIYLILFIAAAFIYLWPN